MGVNLKEEAKKMQTQVSGGAEAQPGIISAFPLFRRACIPRDKRKACQ